MITLEGDQLVFKVPEVHEDALCAVEFQRTLRIPDDGKDYSPPPGVGVPPSHNTDKKARPIVSSFTQAIWRKKTKLDPRLANSCPPVG